MLASPEPAVSYLHLPVLSTLPALHLTKPWRCVLMLETAVAAHWQNEVSDWLVTNGCRYAMSWGVDCSSWDDAIDWANLAQADFKLDWESAGVLTTWHEDEPLEEVFGFCKHNATQTTGDEPIVNTLILHIAHQPAAERLLALYAAA